MSGALSSINWQGVIIGTALIASIAFLIAWQTRGELHKSPAWQNSCALVLELLGVSLSIFWAVTAPEGELLPWVFAAGFTAMTVGRAVAITSGIEAVYSHNVPTAVLSLCTLLIAYLALYSSGLFHAVNGSGEAARERLEQSKPALALDSEIEAARAKLAGLSGYADPSAADKEAQSIAADVRARQERIAALQSEITAGLSVVPARENGKTAGKSLSALTRNCSADYSGFYSGHCATVNTARNELERLQRAFSVQPVYSQRNAEYNSVQAHLLSLEKQRAALSENGGGVQSMWRDDTLLIAWLFGLEPQKADAVKWILYTAVFDVLSLFFRLNAAVILATAGATLEEHNARKRFMSLLRGGYSLNEAAAILTGNQMLPAAVVQRTGDPVPALDTGGKIVADGVAFLHKGERVLNVQETAKYEAQKTAPSANHQSAQKGECLHCGKKIPGNARSIYCSYKCRKSAYLGEEFEQAAETAGYEAAQAKEDATAGVKTSPVITAGVKTSPVITAGVKRHPLNGIGSTGQCEHCGGDYIRNAHNQRFCCEQHRIAFWETRTGAKVKKRKKADM